MYNVMVCVGIGLRNEDIRNGGTNTKEKIRSK